MGDTCFFQKKMKPVLKKRALFVEQIRHLLTQTNGRFALHQFSSLYTAEFGVPANDEASTFLRKGKLPRYGMNVANYSGLKWAVWAPNAYPIPSHRQMVRKKNLLPILNLADTSPMNVDFSAIHKEATDIIDRIDDSLNEVPEASSNVRPPTKMSSGYQETEVTQSESVLESEFTSSSELPQSSSNSSNLLQPIDIIGNRSGPDDDDDDDDDDKIRMLATAYDFLKDDPELLARLSEKPEGTMAAFIDTTAMPEDDVTVLTEVLEQQRFHHSGSTIGPSSGSTTSGSSHKTTEELSSGRVPVPPDVHSSTIGTGVCASDGELPLLLGSGPVDFLEQGLDPDQVLDQLQKLKEASGGILKPDQMTPFFDYFGELSSRELDRIEKLEAQANPHKNAGNGEVRKKKRNMAIRFPSQSKPNALPQRELSLSGFSDHVGKLPVANFDDLSSDESGSEVKPFSREEFIREALRKEGREKDMAHLLGDVSEGDSHRVTDSLLDTADLDTLSKLDSARNDLESFLRQERDL